MPVKDIRALKNALRGEIKARRRALDPARKARLDARVAATVFRLRQYQRAHTVLLYMSTPIEVGTRSIIEHALMAGKRVALPRCVPGTRQMDFHLIRSLDDLEKGSFGLLEPRAGCPLYDGGGLSVCLVPALCYDRAGYRLGYGGGYYDRFLSAYRGPRVGVIYAADIRRLLPHGRFDRPVDIIASDAGFFYTRTSRGRGRAARGAGPPR